MHEIFSFSVTGCQDADNVIQGKCIISGKDAREKLLFFSQDAVEDGAFTFLRQNAGEIVF
jgi:hypothetical protein